MPQIQLKIYAVGIFPTKLAVSKSSFLYEPMKVSNFNLIEILSLSGRHIKSKSKKEFILNINYRHNLSQLNT